MPSNPATPEEALAPLQFDRRIPYMWIEPVFVPRASAPQAAAARAAIGRHPSHGKAPSLPGLAVYVTPQPDRAYVIGADPAEGNPNSDESAATALDSSTGEEVAALAGQIEPTVFAGYLGQLARWYNDAAILSERNNHGHTVLAALAATGGSRVLCGHDGKPGCRTPRTLLTPCDAIRAAHASSTRRRRQVKSPHRRHARATGVA